MAYSKEYRQSLESFGYLWKTADEKWLDDQNEAWRILRNNIYIDSEADEVGDYQDYFVYGQKKNYIPPSTLYFLTPFENRDQSDEFFNSVILTDRDRCSLAQGGFVRGLVDIGPDCRSIVRKKVRELVEWRRGSGLHDVYVNDRLCYRPDDFSKSYLDQVFNLYLKRQEYSPSLDLMDYFLRSFPLLKDEEQIEKIKSRNRVHELIDWSEDLIIDKKATSGMREQAKELLDNRGQIERIWNKIINNS